MTGPHPDLTVELRRLAQTVLDRLDPAVRMAAARATGGGAGSCEQVWCPVCAIAALINGEQHPLLTIVAEHSVALLAVVRAMTENVEDAPRAHPDIPRQTPPPADEPAPSGPGRYQHIPIDIDE